MNDCVTRKVLARLFPGRPMLAQFAWDTEAKRTGREALEDAGLARNAGLAIDRGQLEEMTGYTLSDAPQSANPGGFGGFGPSLNSQKAPSGVAKPLQNAPRGAGATDIPQDGETRSDAILRDFAADLGPAAEKIKSLLDALDAGKDVRDEARKLAEELPDLMADDPAMAAVIEEAMAEAFASAAGGGRAVENARGGNPDNTGQFSKTEGPVHKRDREPETKRHHDRYGATDEAKLVAEPNLNEERGMAAIEEVMRKKGTAYVDKAMYREESGWIRFDWGWEGNPHPDEKGTTHKGGHGLAHVAAKEHHDPRQIPALIARGVARKNPAEPDKIYFVGESSFAVVASLSHGSKRIITEFEPEGKNNAKWAQIQKYPQAKKPGEN